MAAHDKAGPALTLSFVAAGVACIFAALCYAEFAAMVPVAGSAYTYAYATLGELFAWIIGWDLVLEYAVGAATVAHGWSHYFQAFLKIFHLRLPLWMTRAPFDYVDTGGGVMKVVSTGTFIDLPAILIAFLMTVILVIGIKESARFNAAMVVVKLAVVIFVIAVGSFYIDPNNWKPFAPYGYGGISFFGQPPSPASRDRPRASSPARPRSSSPTSGSTRSRPTPRRPRTPSATCRSASSSPWSSAHCSTSRWPPS